MSETATRAATLTIKSPGKMTKRGRKDIARWLRELADALEEQGEQYTDGHFTAGFNYFK